MAAITLSDLQNSHAHVQNPARSPLSLAKNTHKTIKIHAIDLNNKIKNITQKLGQIFKFVQVLSKHI